MWSGTRISPRWLARRTVSRTRRTVASNTSHAIPAILSGRYPTAVDDAPTLQYFPVNLFTTLARHYDMFASMRIPALSASSVSDSDSTLSGDSLESLLSDLGLVWLHIILPEALAEGLPPVTEDWAEFGEHRETDLLERSWQSKGALCAVRVVDRRSTCAAPLHARDAAPQAVCLCSVRTPVPDPDNADFDTKEGPSREPATGFADAAHQRHLAQVGIRRPSTSVFGNHDCASNRRTTRLWSSSHPITARATDNGRSRRQPHNATQYRRHPACAAVHQAARSATRRGGESDCRNRRHPSHDSRCRRRESAPSTRRAVADAESGSARNPDLHLAQPVQRRSQDHQRWRFFSRRCREPRVEGASIWTRRSRVAVRAPGPPAFTRAELIGDARDAGREGHDSQPRAVRQGRSRPAIPFLCTWVASSAHPDRIPSRSPLW